MDIGYEKERFVSFKIKASVAKKFRKFSKGISKSQSMTLLLMLDFFDQNKISPTESLGPNMKSLENNLKGRINALIAIIKDIEKNKVNPTLAILESLMEAADPKNKKWNQKRRDYEEDDSHPDFYK
jgi:hypothetical protein